MGGPGRITAELYLATMSGHLLGGILGGGYEFFRGAKVVEELAPIADTAEWTNISRGLQTRRVGDWWIKQVNPEANSLMQAWGRHSLQTQARALEKLGDLAVRSSFEDGVLYTQHAGGTPSLGTWAETFFKGTGRIGFPNNIRPWNMGANGLVFDPAYDFVDKSILFGGGVAASGVTVYGVGTYNGLW